MKKTVYIVCLCMLSVLVFYEMKNNIKSGTSSGRYVPTARFSSAVKEENNNAGKKTAYLTFDDGPSDNTIKILETLKEKDAVATFFLIGSQITSETKPIVEREIEQNNAVGVHTYCHEKDKMYCNAKSFLDDFQKTSDAIREITGKKPDLHRFPWGSNNGYVSSYVDELHQKLQKDGIKSFDWNVSGEDSIGGTVTQSSILKNVKKDVTRYRQPIILLHDSNSTKNTSAVLGRIIDYIREQGYTFDTLENREEYMFPASWR